jgi:hypothetical protein
MEKLSTQRFHPPESFGRITRRCGAQDPRNRSAV